LEVLVLLAMQSCQQPSGWHADNGVISPLLPVVPEPPVVPLEPEPPESLPVVHAHGSKEPSELQSCAPALPSAHVHAEL